MKQSEKHEIVLRIERESLLLYLLLEKVESNESQARGARQAKYLIFILATATNNRDGAIVASPSVNFRESDVAGSKKEKKKRRRDWGAVSRSLAN